MYDSGALKLAPKAVAEGITLGSTGKAHAGAILAALLAIATALTSSHVALATRIVVGVLSTLVTIALIFSFWSRWESSKPNEWLLVVQDGELVRAGIGLSVFRQVGQMVVRMPASLHKVLFTAQQVTREMAGIEVAGFVVWAIYRAEDGPFRAYRYLDGMSEGGVADAGANIARMAESILRTQVANLEIKQVLTLRDSLRDKARTEMMQTARGWGIWIETLELTEVKVCSQRLFEDMQCEFRQTAHMHAEKVRDETNAAIARERIATELRTAQARADAAASQRTFEKGRQLQAEQAEEALAKEEQRIRLAAVEQRLELQLREEAARAALEHAREEGQLRLRELRAEAELRARGRKLELDRSMTAANLAVAQLEAVQAVYGGLPLKELKIVHCGGNSAGGAADVAGGLGALLPGLTALAAPAAAAADALK